MSSDDIKLLLRKNTPENEYISPLGDDTHRSMCSVCEKGCIDSKCRYQ